ncbi:protein Aster-B isoform X3 [Plodia interpunctella]|uniref:protein Aster-B isoform X3 n=1 Tax=Plodia interpunctella TaxID=58824 RepID=UPI00236848ED|nr:protein Aster-B-like isoform X3 [Plodia interpunctella]
MRRMCATRRKSVENLVISSQDAIGQSISQALSFSGVITQHTNQIIQENRSVSRSPSPSLRNADAGIDLSDNDKVSELSIPLPSLPAADAVSISSSSEAVTALTRNDKAGAGRGADGRKKKSWYNSLYPTYKSKSDDFKRLFKDLPDDERLIVDYSCALQKDILAHGRLYASQNYLCFYASIFGWETSMALRWKDVTAITKEKTALVIPNAILVCTESEKNFLTSFSGRDKAYLMLFRIWQNALMDQPMSSQQIWQWVHRCYGEELGFNSDDEGYSRDLAGDAPALAVDTTSEDVLDSSMEASAGTDARPERPRAPLFPRDSSPPLVTNGSGTYRDEEAGDTLPTDMSDTSDSDPDKHNNSEQQTCTSPSHSDGKLLLQQQFPFNVDTMFTMIFTSSKFNLELLAARGTTDYVQAPWQPQGGLECRQCKYTLSIASGPIGPKEVQVTETQVMNKCSKPGVLYSIDSTSENAGIPYADYFTVQVHYCLRREAGASSSLAMYAHVHYKKTMWPVIKSFLEKNTMSGLEDYVRLIESQLSAEAAGAAAAARAGRRRRGAGQCARGRRSTSSLESGVAAAAPRAALLSRRASAARAPAPRPAPSALLLLLLLLLLLNAVLYWRLFWVDRPVSSDDIQHRISSLSGQQMAEWSKLLQQHTARQHKQLAAWQEAIHRSLQHLQQTEEDLRKLLETIKPSLERAADAKDEL